MTSGSLMEVKFKDYFSQHAGAYAQARPTYPAELFRFLASLTLEHELAWDCATGNGQAAVALANYYQQVLASDASQAQIQHAVAHEGVRYFVCPSESSDIAAHRVDLITVAAAIHWFDLEKFYPEARRVLKNGGVIAAWSYAFAKINDTVDPLMQRLAHSILKDYWPVENRLVWNKYAELPFPFEEIKTPAIACTADWNLSELTNYLSTWSAAQRFISANGSNPIEEIFADLTDAWGDPDSRMNIHWELAIRVGRI